MAKKKDEDKKGGVKSIEDKIIGDFGDVIVTGNFVVDKKPTIVPISPAVDNMLGGGVKFGSFVIPTGPQKFGKSATALQLAAHAMQVPHEDGSDRHTYFFSIEGRLNARDLLGIKPWVDNLDKISIIQSRPGKILHAEDFLDIGEQLINEKPGCVFIFDSFSQLCSKSRRDHGWNDKQYRDNVPMLLSNFCKRISNVIPINKSIVVGITHRIANTGIGFSNWSEASGTKIQYQVDTKLQGLFAQPWKVGETKIGQDLNWECACSPLQNGPVDNKCVSKLRYGYGIDIESELINMCVDLGLIKKGGSWYEIDGSPNKLQGLENVRNHLVESRETFTDLNEKFREMMGLPNASVLP